MSNRRAYTLLEVLLAIGIFVIGFVAVAAMFPAAAQMQKSTVDDIQGQQFTRTIKATVRTMSTETRMMAAGAAKDGQIYDVSASVSFDNRSFPARKSRDPADPLDSANKRLYSSVFAKWNDGGWIYFVFILDPTRSTTVPYTSPPAVLQFPVTATVSATAGHTDFHDTSATIDVKAGDKILDNLGGLRIVVDFDSATHTITATGMPDGDPASLTSIRATSPGLCRDIITFVK